MAAWEIYRRHVEALMGEGCEGAGVTEVSLRVCVVCVCGGVEVQ
jgi:hypothetical protein